MELLVNIDHIATLTRMGTGARCAESGLEGEQVYDATTERPACVSPAAKTRRHIRDHERNMQFGNHIRGTVDFEMAATD